MKLRRTFIIIDIIVLIVDIFLIGVALYAKNQNNDAVIQSPDTRQMYYCMPAEELEYELDDVPFISISDHDRYIVECVVAGEAGGHSYELMKAVAQCMAVTMEKRGMTAEEVRTSHGYQGWMPGLAITDPNAWRMVQNAVSEIFDDGNFVTYSLIEYFYNPTYGGSDFHEQQDFVIEIDGVRFFTEGSNNG